MTKRGPKPRPPEERFWEKVDIRGPDECWEWKASRYPNGYGKFQLLAGAALAHRVAWMLTHGEIPTDMCICHHCDNKLCCNPSHLFLGSYADNMADAALKGRTARGTRNSHAKLDETKVRRILRLWATGGYTQQGLADMFGVTQANISYIVLRKTWMWLDDIP